MESVATNWNLFKYLLIHPKNLTLKSINIISTLLSLIASISPAELPSKKYLNFNLMRGLHLNYLICDVSTVYFPFK